MGKAKKHAAAVIGLTLILLPALALAQSYDNESAEGSCNDEMNEAMGCPGNSAYGNYYTPVSQPSSYYQYQPATSYYQPSYYQYQPQYQQQQQYQSQGAYSYMPVSAMPYVIYGQQVAQQYAPTYYSQQQYQYQPSSYYNYGYQYQTSPSYYNYGYGTQNSGYYNSKPQTVSYPTDTYGTFGTPLCYWSDYPTLAPCGKDPQQWIQDPYTGQWY